MADQAINVWDGTPFTVISLGVSIGSTYVVGGNTALNNAADAWPLALATIRVQDGLGGTPVTGVTIGLYMIRGEIESGVDSSGLAAYAALAHADAHLDVNGMEYIDSFVLDADAGDFKRQITFSMLGIREAKFYIKNNTGTTLECTSNNLTVKIEGLSLKPAV